jgi:hypothetical protein
MRRMAFFGWTAVVVMGGALLGSTGSRAAPASAECSGVGDLNFVCGVTNAEDVLPVPGGRFLVGSSLKAGSVGLYLIDTSAKRAAPVALSIADRHDAGDESCVPPDLKGLNTHGLDVTGGSSGTLVYAINHGGRESVEIFRLFPERGAAQWIGCAILPAGANGNAVSVLPSGSFAVTKFMTVGDAQGFAHMLAGEVTGTVYLWERGKGFREVPGTRLSGDNGILVSRDGHWLYVNAYGSNEIVRVPLEGHGERASVKVDFHPDNLRWAPDGQILATGQFLGARNLDARHGWATVRIDPRTMKATLLVKEPGYAQFDDATTAVQIGSVLWFGTFRGDRVAYRALAP